MVISLDFGGLLFWKLENSFAPHRTKIRPCSSMLSYPYQVSDMISQDIKHIDTASDWLIASLNTVI